MPPVPVASYFVEVVAESFQEEVLATLVSFPMMKKVVNDPEPEAESEAVEV